MQRIDSARLAEHRNRASCWLAIHGTVWDVTNFLDHHPGGAGLLLKSAGQDATAQYEQFHDASLVEETLGQGALIGELNRTQLIRHIRTQSLNPEETLANAHLSAPC